MVVTNFLCPVSFFFFFLQPHHDIIAVYDVKYLCVISPKSVEKKRFKSRTFESVFGSKTSTTQFREVI